MKNAISVLIATILLTTFGLGAANARGPWMAGMGNTQGWQLMTPEERVEHQTKMRSFKTYDECKAYQGEHHALMQARATEKGVTLPLGRPGGFGCENMKARGFLK